MKVVGVGRRGVGGGSQHPFKLEIGKVPIVYPKSHLHIRTNIFNIYFLDFYSYFFFKILAAAPLEASL